VTIIGSRLVQTPLEPQPYKVVIEFDGGLPPAEYPVATVREGETLIREKLPSPSRADTMERGVDVPGAFANARFGQTEPMREDPRTPPGRARR
jgi:hypothetical protein